MFFTIEFLQGNTYTQGIGVVIQKERICVEEKEESVVLTKIYGMWLAVL